MRLRNTAYNQQIPASGGGHEGRWALDTPNIKDRRVGDM